MRLAALNLDKSSPNSEDKDQLNRSLLLCYKDSTGRSGFLCERSLTKISCGNEILEVPIFLQFVPEYHVEAAEQQIRGYAPSLALIHLNNTKRKMSKELWVSVVQEVQLALLLLGKVTEHSVKRVLGMQLKQLEYVVSALSDSKVSV